eukprot:Colp12_sorted_trinity150504_noHs@25853
MNNPRNMYQDGDDLDGSASPQSMRQAKLEKMKSLEEQKRKQRQSTAGMVFQSDRPSSARPGSARGGRPQSAAQPKVIQVQANKNTEILGSNGSLADSQSKPISDVERELRARGIAPIYDPVREDPMPKKKNEKKVVIDTSNLQDFVSKPAPQGVKILCRITRVKTGVEKNMFPTYYLHMEEPNGQRTFLLAARKRKMSKSSNYILSTSTEDLARQSHHYVGKLRSNFVGTSFTVFDGGESEKKGRLVGDGSNLRKELAAVSYDTNLLGLKGPRKMTVIIPGMRSDGTRVDFRPQGNEDTLLDRHKSKNMTDLLVLHNKSPVWNEETQSYVLNFHGRVTVASVKNFQIVHDNDLDYIIMQFGRVGDEAFTMDYQYPMSAIQAFGIALSSFDGKLACE